MALASAALAARRLTRLLPLPPPVHSKLHDGNSDWRRRVVVVGVGSGAPGFTAAAAASVPMRRLPCDAQRVVPCGCVLLLAQALQHERDTRLRRMMEDCRSPGARAASPRTPRRPPPNRRTGAHCPRVRASGSAAGARPSRTHTKLGELLLCRKARETRRRLVAKRNGGAIAVAIDTNAPHGAILPEERAQGGAIVVDAPFVHGFAQVLIPCVLCSQSTSSVVCSPSPLARDSMPLMIRGGCHAVDKACAGNAPHMLAVGSGQPLRVMFDTRAPSSCTRERHFDSIVPVELLRYTGSWPTHS